MKKSISLKDYQKIKDYVFYAEKLRKWAEINFLGVKLYNILLVIQAPVQY
jgi:hypothetical protein